MLLQLPAEIIARLAAAMTGAARREIGGILMGEHVEGEVFRVREVTVQHRGGTRATFRRAADHTESPLRAFLDDTGHDYRRFNYLGEWHSHPAFTPEPSAVDHQTMRDIIDDPDVGAYFATLLIVRLDEQHRLQGTVTVYLPGGRIFGGQLIQEDEDDS